MNTLSTNLMIYIQIDLSMKDVLNRKYEAKIDCQVSLSAKETQLEYWIASILINYLQNIDYF